MRDTKEDRVFARKLIFGLPRDAIDVIENEARAISKLCAPGAVGVVEVLRHGWSAKDMSSWYYIDMEFCAQTLEHWLHDSSSVDGAETQLGPRFAEFQAPVPPRQGPSLPATHGHKPASQISLAQSRLPQLTPNREEPDELDEGLRVMEDIASGLKYVHESGLAHRDLKPSNGNFRSRIL
jgi:hypothetical protein